MKNNIMSILFLCALLSCSTRKVPKSTSSLEIDSSKLSKENVYPVYDSLEMIKLAQGHKERTFKIHSYINENIKYPLEAKEKGVEGSVMIRYQVLTDSTVKIKVVNGIGYGCDEEAERILREALLYHFDLEFVNTIVLTSVTFRLN